MFYRKGPHVNTIQRLLKTVVVTFTHEKIISVLEIFALRPLEFSINSTNLLQQNLYQYPWKLAIYTHDAAIGENSD